MVQQNMVRWVTAANIVRFRELLRASTNQAEREQLEYLLAQELDKQADESPPPVREEPSGPSKHVT